MPFSVSWHTLLDELDDLSDGAELVTPLSHNRFRIADVQEQRVVVAFAESDERRPLQRDQFETLYLRTRDSPGGFDLDHLPPDADPYPAVLSLHPRFEIDEERGVIVEKEGPTVTQLVGGDPTIDESERVEPDGLDVYSDALLLVDALERHEVSDLSGLETNVLVNLYTLCSDVQRNADAFRKDVADVLLGRLHHDQPVHGQYGSVQRTSRRNRSLKDDKQYWLYAAVDPETNRILHSRLFSTYTIPIAREFLTDLAEKHDVEDALFLVDDADDLIGGLRREGYSYRIQQHGFRNHVERVFREVERRNSSFSNCFSHVDPPTAETWLQSHAVRWNHA